MAQYSSIDKVVIRRAFYESGALRWEIPYVNGNMHGIARFYYASGALRRETPYVTGRMHGIEREYNKDTSNISYLTLYDRDREVSSLRRES